MMVPLNNLKVLFWILTMFMVLACSKSTPMSAKAPQINGSGFGGTDQLAAAVETARKQTATALKQIAAGEHTDQLCVGTNLGQSAYLSTLLSNLKSEPENFNFIKNNLVTAKNTLDLATALLGATLVYTDKESEVQTKDGPQDAYTKGKTITLLRSRIQTKTAAELWALLVHEAGHLIGLSDEEAFPPFAKARYFLDFRGVCVAAYMGATGAPSSPIIASTSSAPSFKTFFQSQTSFFGGLYSDVTFVSTETPIGYDGAGKPLAAQSRDAQGKEINYYLDNSSVKFWDINSPTPCTAAPLVVTGCSSTLGAKDNFITANALSSTTDYCSTGSSLSDYYKSGSYQPALAKGIMGKLCPADSGACPAGMKPLYWAINKKTTLLTNNHDAVFSNSELPGLNNVGVLGCGPQ